MSEAARVYAENLTHAWKWFQLGNIFAFIVEVVLGDQILCRRVYIYELQLQVMYWLIVSKLYYTNYMKGMLYISYP